MPVYVGTAGWSYPGGQGRWDGIFYPEGLADRDKLPFYAQYFDAVELNSSFYRPPSSQTARGWAARVPERFRFTAKLWQKFTHPKMFESATGHAAEPRAEDFEQFVAGLQPLAAAGKLGALLAQFPPSFKPSEGTLDYLADLIRRLKAEGLRVAVELRHRDWTSHEFGPRARILFVEEGVAWTMIDEPKFRTSIRDVPQTSELAYFRFHGRNYQQWWRHDAPEDRYDYRYSAPEQQELAAEVKDISGRAHETYVFYNNHHSAQVVVNALELRATFGQVPEAPLPVPLLARYPELARADG